MLRSLGLLMSSIHTVYTANELVNDYLVHTSQRSMKYQSETLFYCDMMPCLVLRLLRFVDMTQPALSCQRKENHVA